MAIKKSVRLSDETELLCKALSQDTEVNWSGSINSIAARYNILISQLLPELSDKEKNAIYCAYNGRMLNIDIMLEVAAFDFTISEAIKYDSQIEHLIGSDHIESFYKRCKEFSIAEKLAIIDMAQKYWRKSP